MRVTLSAAKGLCLFVDSTLSEAEVLRFAQNDKNRVHYMFAANVCRPHSFLSDPAQRPARSPSPSFTGRVQHSGQQPMLG